MCTQIGHTSKWLHLISHLHFASAWQCLRAILEHHKLSRAHWYIICNFKELPIFFFFTTKNVLQNAREMPDAGAPCTEQSAEGQQPGAKQHSPSGNGRYIPGSSALQAQIYQSKNKISTVMVQRAPAINFMPVQGCKSTSSVLLHADFHKWLCNVKVHYTNLPLWPRSGQAHEALSAQVGKAGIVYSISSTD